MTTDHKIVFLFSGQGSHYRGMGKNLYEIYPCFAASLDQSDYLMRKRLGQSLIEALYYSKDKIFDDLLLTHPAIVAVELAMLDLLSELGISPDYVAGSSIGEFAAAAAAGIWTKELALETAIEQAKSIVQGGVEGGMLAVVNECKSNLEYLLEKSGLYVASENFATHFTLSGKVPELDRFQKQLDRLDVQYSRLPVAYPFHSPLIDAGKMAFLHYLYTMPSAQKPAQEFISGLFAGGVRDIPEDYFWSVVSQPASFIQLVDYLEAKGPCLYLDVGPSGTGATFVKYNLSGQSRSIPYQIMTPFRREEAQLQTLVQMLERKKE